MCEVVKLPQHKIIAHNRWCKTVIIKLIINRLLFLDGVSVTGALLSGGCNY